MMRINPEQAALGMYVQGFDGSWLSHPFWKAHFFIQTDEELARVRDGGIDIFIDPVRGTRPLTDPAAKNPASQPSAIPPKPIPLAILSHEYFAKRPARRIVAPPAFGKADKARAKALAQRSTKVVKAIFDGCRLGRSIYTPQILEVVKEIAKLLESSGTAFACVTRLKAKDDYTYTHSVAVCALMVNLAREIGVSSKEVNEFGMAGLLHDIGKVRIDSAILTKTGELTPLEWTQLLKHPEFGHEILKGEAGLPPVVLDVSLNHHERLNGTGYPFGLRGDAITKAARMSAICDVYDAMTSDRPYKKGKTPIEAITEMEKMADHFDRNLLFLFMRSIGVFPSNKLIRLRSNRLAITLPPRHVDRKPIARAFYSTIDGHFVNYEDVVIGDRLSDDQAVSQEEPSAWFSRDWQAIEKQIAAEKLHLL